MKKAFNLYAKIKTTKKFQVKLTKAQCQANYLFESRNQLDEKHCSEANLDKMAKLGSKKGNSVPQSPRS